ncbi:790_t:CDS:2 [Gigaspora margarita]|uniref:790_t:CDS:1 n=1 Tax=Gigaspora margarita TaxID=4874 RepID=A0ABM8VXV4_GIGMA|nr:790_t:CDS:2 [Gigaspora margarita]
MHYCSFCGSTHTDNFTLKLSNNLKITKGLCERKKCFDKLVEMSEELESIRQKYLKEF